MFGFGNNKPEWGIALGGGGVRGFAHFGVLQALEEKGIKPGIISGVSAGAIAGVFIAAGMSPLESFKALNKYKFRDITKFGIPRNGLLSLEKLREKIEKEIDAETFEELEIPLIVGVSNVLKGKVEYVTEGPISQVVQASASIPVLFSPVKINDQLYLDGGIFDNLPVKALKGKCKKIIGVSVSPVQEVEKLNGLIDVAGRTFQLTVNSKLDEEKQGCDIFIEPTELDQYDILDTDHNHEIFEIGYNKVMSMDV